MEKNDEKYVVDFKGVHYYLEIHKALKEGLDFPDYYGFNLGALWDCLTDMIENDTEIILKNFQNVENTNKEYAEKILSIFKRTKHYDDDRYVGARIIVERNGVETEIE